jgi:hypothetical protein
LRRDGPRRDSAQKERPPPTAASPKSNYLFDQAAARVFFRFQHLARKPITPRPVAKIGRAAGSGVADLALVAFQLPGSPVMLC